jgi:hypothetical protein
MQVIMGVVVCVSAVGVQMTSHEFIFILLLLFLLLLPDVQERLLTSFFDFC